MTDQPYHPDIDVELTHSMPLETSAFLNAGLGAFTYARPYTDDDGSVGIAVMAANGQQVAFAPDMAHAYAYAVQQDWDLLSVH